jgi:hypothetical protein
VAAERASRPRCRNRWGYLGNLLLAKIKEIIAEDRIMSGGQPGATRNPLTPAQEPGRSGARAPLPPIPAIEHVSAAISEDGVVAGARQAHNAVPRGTAILGPSARRARNCRV